jgi:hypothetical protein
MIANGSQESHERQDILISTRFATEIVFFHVTNTSCDIGSLLLEKVVKALIFPMEPDLFRSLNRLLEI